MLTGDKRAEAIVELLDEIDEYLTDIHELDERGCIVSPMSEDGDALFGIFSQILDLKFRPDCDRWIPVSFALRDVANQRSVGFDYMPRPRGDWTTEWWDESLKVALSNIAIAIREYDTLQRVGRPEEKTDES